MNFIQFRSLLGNLLVFSISDIRIIDNNFDRRRLSEWQAKGYIKKIIKGHYVFTDTRLDEDALFAVANKIYIPSYVSFETALSFHHLIPESSYGITSASTRRTYRFATRLSHFSYRTVSHKLFFGYTVRPDHAKMATPEKAILDYFYIHAALQTDHDFAALRIDHEEFMRQVNMATMLDFLGRFGNRSLSLRINRFLEWIHHA